LAKATSHPVSQVYPLTIVIVTRCSRSERRVLRASSLGRLGERNP
jgi:hypothetical protein